MKNILLLTLTAAALLGCSRGNDADDGTRTRSAPGAQPAAPAAGGAPAAQPGTIGGAASAEPGQATSPAAGAGSSAARPAGTSSARPGTPSAPAESTAPAAADSAARILTRAAERYEAVRSLQADFQMVYENPLLRSRTEGAGVLYQKRPDRLLLRFTDPAGDIVLSDGEYFWLYYPSVQPDQVIRSPATQGGASGVDLQAQFLGDPTRRFAYQLHGEENVGGRRAWLLTLTPRERTGYRRLRVWIDQRDYLARRFEITEDNGAVRRFELRNLRVNPALGDALFRFDPPPGVRVITQ